MSDFLVHSIEMKPFFANKLQNFRTGGSETLQVADFFDITSEETDGSKQKKLDKKNLIHYLWVFAKGDPDLEKLHNQWILLESFAEVLMIIFLGVLGICFEFCVMWFKLLRHLLKIIFTSWGKEFYEEDSQDLFQFRQFFSIVERLKSSFSNFDTKENIILTANEIWEFYSAVASLVFVIILSIFLNRRTNLGSVKMELNVAFLKNASETSNGTMQDAINIAWDSISSESCSNLNTSRIGWGDVAQFEVFSIPTSFYELNSNVFAGFLFWVLIVSVLFQTYRSNFFYCVFRNNLLLHDPTTADFSKWIEYFFTSAIQLVIISNANLVQNWFILILLFAAQLSLIVLGYFIELGLEHYRVSSRRFLQYKEILSDNDTKIKNKLTDHFLKILCLLVFAWILHLHIWIPLLNHFYIQSDLLSTCFDGNAAQPDQIKILLVLTFVLFSSFGVVQTLHIIQSNFIVQKFIFSAQDSNKKMENFDQDFSYLNLKISLIYDFLSVFSKLFFEGFLISVFFLSN